MSGAKGVEEEEVTVGWLTGHLCPSCSLVRGSSEMDEQSNSKIQKSETTSIEYEFAAPRNAY